MEHNQDPVSTNNKNPQDLSKEEFASHLALRHDLLVLFKKILGFLGRTLSIREGTDIEGTTEGIMRDMVFRGHTAWILMASIMIASIGLNVNSPAVVIGAMLISPLMGPILAIGLAVGTNDWETLVKALKNFGIAIVISLLTSTFYFLISPLSEIQSELLSRTRPTFLDVLIALFGGFAGIVAGSRREKSNVIPGVAIATALMPPLCTAGYGLATSNYQFFFGAFYLFFLNSVFISISTFLVVRYLHFPIKNLINAQRERKLKLYMAIFVLIVILPSAALFWEVIRESRFNAAADFFIKNEIAFTGSEVINTKKTYSDTLSTIDVYIIGKEVSQDRIDELNRKVKIYDLAAGETRWQRLFDITDQTQIRVHQARDNTEAFENRLNSLSSDLSKEVRTGILEEIYQKNEALIKSKDEKISFLENQLLIYKKDTLPLKTIRKELHIQYPDITKFAYAESIEPINDTIVDTIPSFIIHWIDDTPQKEIDKQSLQLHKWLSIRLNMDTIRVITF